MGELKTTRHSVGGYEINIAEAGSADAATVVFLHGSGPGASGASNFRDNYAKFVDAGYHVLLPDLIGYGGSSKPEGIDYTLELFTDTVVAALKAHGVTKAAFIGNSLGGGIAIQIALDHPEMVTSLVLMAPGCIEDQMEYFKMPGIAKMKSGFGSPDFNIDEQRNLIRNLVHPSFADKITEELVASRFAVAQTQSKDVLARMKTPNLAPRIGELDQPILVLWGRDDEFCPESGIQHFLDADCDARCMSFTDVGHWVQVERADEFNSHVVAFLNGQS